MITGVVSSLEARIRIKVRGPSGRERQIKAVVDSGYNGLLTLPSAVVIALALPWQSTVDVTLADGSKALFQMYEATIVWDRRVRRLAVAEAGDVPLVGMSLLSGYEVTMQVTDQGKVRIKRLT